MAADAPDLAGFREAMDRKRAAFGEDVEFFWPAERTYAPGVALNASGEPLDPTVDPIDETQRTETVTATVASSLGIKGQSDQAPIGRIETGTLMLNLSIDDEPLVDGAESFVRDGERYQIIDSRQDGIGPDANRFLVVGKQET